jgi:hypothetical protein
MCISDFYITNYFFLNPKPTNKPLEGNLWHADHVVPVHCGGGECGLENMRRYARNTRSRWALSWVSFASVPGLVLTLFLPQLVCSLPLPCVWGTECCAGGAAAREGV